MPMIEYIDAHRAHVFECVARSCHSKNRLVHQFLDIGDAKSTSNLHQHVKVCWGEEAMAAANNTWGVKTAQDVLAHVKVMDGSIMVLFQCAAKGRVTLQSLPTH